MRKFFIMILFIVYSVSVMAVTPVVQYDWEMKTRFGVDADYDGIRKVDM